MTYVPVPNQSKLQELQNKNQATKYVNFQFFFLKMPVALPVGVQIFWPLALSEKNIELLVVVGTPAWVFIVYFYYQEQIYSF